MIPTYCTLCPSLAVVVQRRTQDSAVWPLSTEILCCHTPCTHSSSPPVKDETEHLHKISQQAWNQTKSQSGPKVGHHCEGVATQRRALSLWISGQITGYVKVLLESQQTLISLSIYTWLRRRLTKHECLLQLLSLKLWPLLRPGYITYYLHGDGSRVNWTVSRNI